MRNNNVQMSLFDTYNNVCQEMEENKSGFLELMRQHIDFENLIPAEFYLAFHRWFGRPRKIALVSFIKYFTLQAMLGIDKDTTMLTLLKISIELRDFCEFDKVPAASQITRFRQDFVSYIKKVFDNLVEITEPICREIDAKKSDYLIYDPTGIEAYVSENNPKFLNSKIKDAKKLAKRNPDINPFSLAYSSMPETAKSNPFVKQQYINGHFCYAHKAGILTNGLGIVRDIAFFDENFKRRHPEVVSKKTDNPQFDKEIGDSTSLKPVLLDFLRHTLHFRSKPFLVILRSILMIHIQCYATISILREYLFRLTFVIPNLQMLNMTIMERLFVL